jgi:hypothetical protein
LGETTQSEPTVIWLSSGEGSSRRYISVSIAPVTGLTSIGSFQATAPSFASYHSGAGMSGSGMPGSDMSGSGMSSAGMYAP